MQFTSIIRNEAELRALMGDPIDEAVLKKSLPRLDRHCTAFIQKSPFILVATADSAGRLDVSPKGDAPGFVMIADETTLLIPDRPGNRRYDSFTNLLQNPRIGLIFLIPGKRETLRISGTAQIIRDAAVLETLSAQGKVPALATAVHVEEAFLHCAKSMIRSQLWSPEAWQTLDGLPTLAEAMKDAAAMAMPLEAIEQFIAHDQQAGLY